MEKWEKIGNELNDLLRLQTFPVGVKFLKKGEDFPEKTRRPKEKVGQPIALCQGMTLTRKYGWTLGFGQEDLSCPVNKIAIGWDEGIPDEMFKTFLLGIGYAKDEAAVAKIKGNMDYLDGEKYSGIVMTPLTRPRVGPDVVMVFGLPAQVMRLAHGVSALAGELVEAGVSGRAGSCGEGLFRSFVKDRPIIALPGNGDRVFAGVQDNEIVFSAPAGQMDDIIEMVKLQHQRGVRYPIPALLNYNLPFERLMG